MDIKKKSAGRPKGSVNKKTLSKMTKKERDAYKISQKKQDKIVPKTYLEDATEAVVACGPELPLDLADAKRKGAFLPNGKFAPGNQVAKLKRNPWRLALKAIPEEDIQRIKNALVENCLKGDIVAIQTLFKVVIPNQKEPEPFKTLKTSNAQELDKSMDEVIAAVTSGEMDTETAMEYIKILDTKRAFIHSAVLEVGLDNMKDRLAGNK